MKYRKKPVVIDAEQFKDPIDKQEADYWFLKKIWWDSEGHFFYIATLEGNMQVSNGDWIITGVKGEKYPCKDDIFKMTYEKVEE